MQDNRNAEIEKLQLEVAELRQASRLAEVYKRDLQHTAEEVILDLPIVRIGRWILAGAITAGIAVWIGGAIYGTVQIRSVQQQAAETLNEIRRIEKDVTDAQAKIEEVIESETGVVKEAAARAAREIGEDSKRARQKLAVDQLPDLRKLNASISTLKREGDKLNLNSLAALSGFAVWSIIGSAGLAFVISIIALIRSR